VIEMAIYPIWIGASPSGLALVGAAACDDWGAVVTEQIYPSQLRHRVVARNETGALEIVTPTDARARGLEITDRFPAADGSVSARRGKS
jgi:hypothetical protein